MLKVRVENLSSRRGTQRKIPNQFIIQTGDGLYFQSYSTVIAFKPINAPIVLDRRAWNYSRTTSKYRNIFLGESKKETEAKIKSGEYLLENLN